MWGLCIRGGLVVGRSGRSGIVGARAGIRRFGRCCHRCSCDRPPPQRGWQCSPHRLQSAATRPCRRRLRSPRGAFATIHPRRLAASLNPVRYGGVGVGVIETSGVDLVHSHLVAQLVVRHEALIHGSEHFDYVKPICPSGGHGRGHRLALPTKLSRGSTRTVNR